ncbi:hypothetical protein M0804_002034 [Polistes exclamans]|nr:hypothetical protein M0804_002034 [Polistes exclamans]
MGRTGNFPFTEATLSYVGCMLPKCKHTGTSRDVRVMAVKVVMVVGSGSDDGGGGSGVGDAQQPLRLATTGSSFYSPKCFLRFQRGK